MPDLHVYAPADGILHPLERVPDPAFAQRMLGDGAAVEPSAGFTVAPFDGTVTSVHKALHAVTLRQGETEALIHIGVDTVSLQGRGFTMLVQAGDQVKRGQKLSEFDKDFLSAHTPSNWVILVITSPENAALSKRSIRDVHAGKDEIFSVQVPQGCSAQAPAQEEGWLYSRMVTLGLTSGLHARPAARLAEAAKGFSFPIEVETENARTADAKSLVALMGLNLERGARVRVRAAAQDSRAREAAEQLAALLEKDENGSPGNIPSPQAEQPAAGQTDFTASFTVKALTACPGLALGKTWRLHTEQIRFEQQAADPQAERLLLDRAVEETLQDFAAEAAAAPNQTAREITQAHVQLLKDPLLLQKAREAVQRGKSAPAAFNEAIRAGIDILKSTRNRFLMERTADLKDLRRRVLLKLTGGGNAKPDFPDGCILLAKELLPSDLPLLDGRVKGVLLAQSSPTAHVSILLRNMGLPALVAAGDGILDAPDGTDIALNATEGLAFFNPSAPEKQRLTQRVLEETVCRQEQQQAACTPALTADGVHIHVTGNASSEREAAAANANGADGLGLIRTEFLFYRSQQPPSEEEQYRIYQNMAAALHGRPVTLRTLDVGGDKPVSYMPLEAEPNPIVGLRGVRNYTAYRQIFLSQIRAILRIQPAGAARIMLPMVTFADELKLYKQLIEEEKKSLGITAPVQTGIMVEVPAAALTARRLAEYADFFSLGTNDLTQYALAIDRGHRSLCARADHAHPAVLKLIDLTCQGAAPLRRPVAVCGAMAGDLQAVPLLIGLGVTELAVGAGAVAQVKALVRTLRRAQCQELARQALTLEDAAQVRALIRRELNI